VRQQLAAHNPLLRAAPPPLTRLTTMTTTCTARFPDGMAAKCNSSSSPAGVAVQWVLSTLMRRSLWHLGWHDSNARISPQFFVLRHVKPSSSLCKAVVDPCAAAAQLPDEISPPRSIVNSCHRLTAQRLPIVCRSCFCKTISRMITSFTPKV
jgi:hypothetical protein